ncbi:MAG TPA: hypothetical protein VM261_15965 [Kofleriaceae bacterium]|nr:hypothetical protein [Kofleriaceae bacterium]
MTTKTLFAAAALVATAILACPDDARAETVWTPENINRPLTMPASSFAAGAAFSALPGLDGLELKPFKTFALGVNGNYGISDELEVYGAYTYVLDPSNAGQLRVGVGYAAVRGAAGGKLEIVPRADLGYNLDPGGLAPLVAGLQLQYTLAPKFAIVMPATHLSVALEGDAKPITFGVPVGFLFQAAPTFYAQLDTTLATFAINEDAGDSAFIFDASIPLALTAAYNSQTLDVGVTVSDDLKNAGDLTSLVVFARYYGGV